MLAQSDVLHQFSVEKNNPSRHSPDPRALPSGDSGSSPAPPASPHLLAVSLAAVVASRTWWRLPAPALPPSPPTSCSFPPSLTLTLWRLGGGPAGWRLGGSTSLVAGSCLLRLVAPGRALETRRRHGRRPSSAALYWTGLAGLLRGYFAAELAATCHPLLPRPWRLMAHPRRPKLSGGVSAAGLWRSRAG